MNKKNLTLLIALSIYVVMLILTPLAVTGGQEVKKETATTSSVIITDREEIIAEKLYVAESQLLSLEEIVQEVIEGKWGNGEERKQRLIEAGYDYDAVQSKIDELMPAPAAVGGATVPTQNYVLPDGEYPVATYIWNTLRSWGWSAETCAGVIGNMMAEVGGGTLNLNWSSSGGCGFGLIQWMNGRYNLIIARYGSCPSIDQQLIYMRDELFGTNDTRPQVSADILNVIMNSDGSQSPESIALCFATYYERCAAQYRAMRQGYARAAYQYFITK